MQQETTLADIRILHITARADIGGGQECMLRLMSQTSSLITTFAAAPKEEPYWSRFEELIGHRSLCEIPHRTFNPSAFRRLLEFISHNKISLIHTHGFGAGIYGRLASIWTGVTCIHTFHGVIFKTNKPLWTASRLVAEWLLAFRSSHLIAVSDTERQHLSSWLFPHGRKMIRIHNGIRANYYPLKQNRKTVVTNIVWVGRMHEQKHPQQILEIAAALCRLRPGLDFAFDVVGGGDLFSEVESGVREEGLNRIIKLHGPMENVRPIYERGDLFLSTSRWEGLPNCILEAMTYGLVVVASDVTGNVDLVKHMETGVLFDKSTASQAAELINNLINSPALAESLRDSAYRFVSSEFSMQRCAEKHLELYTGEGLTRSSVRIATARL